MEVVAPDDVQHEGFPNDPQYKFQWHLKQIGMPEAWKLADGNGVIVAVLDTGVGYENYKNMHVLPDLDGLTFVDPYNFLDNTTHAGDDHGHGSHVTGTIAQVTNNGIGVAGIARNVKIMPLKVLSAGGSGSVAGIADAIRFAADHGAKVLNMSLGGPFPSKELKNAVKYAHDKGVIVICAAGNEGRGKVGYPAAYPGAVAVAATQFDESTTFYSNYGKDIDIAAPGGNMRVDQNGDGMMDGVLQNTIVIGNPTEDGYFGFMGTSMAAPHAAGVAALVVGEGVTNPDMVEKILKDSARKPTDQKYDRDKYGAGIIDAPAAVAPGARGGRPAASQLRARRADGCGGGRGGRCRPPAPASASSSGRATCSACCSARQRLVLPATYTSAPGAVVAAPVVHMLTHAHPSSGSCRSSASAGHGNRAVLQRAHPARRCSRSATASPRWRYRRSPAVAVSVAAHLAVFAPGSRR